jgi:SAM-dependent methyltransferase
VGLIKELFKKSLLSFGYELNKTRSEHHPPSKLEIIQKFESSGSLPWSAGYNEYKEEKILEALEDQNISEKFLAEENLPGNFGIGLDERIIEYPWFFSQLKDSAPIATRYLDAGPVMNHSFVVERARKLANEVHFSTLSHEENCFYELDISYLFSNLMHLPIKDNFYDIISCISTLEHIGCNNTCYGNQNNSSSQNNKNYDFLDVAKELFRVLKPEGSLYVSVPFGQYMHLGMIQQFDEEMLDRLVGVFGKEKTKLFFFKYSSNGWQISDRSSCKNSVFVKWLTDSLMNEKFPIPHPIEADRAAAARAICCLRVSGK